MFTSVPPAADADRGGEGDQRHVGGDRIADRSNEVAGIDLVHEDGWVGCRDGVDQRDCRVREREQRRLVGREGGGEIVDDGCTVSVGQRSPAERYPQTRDGRVGTWNRSSRPPSGALVSPTSTKRTSPPGTPWLCRSFVAGDAMAELWE